jgi:flavin reductase (DIM6/NTAB) family NADH-FMN oxidoreductase RutF
VRSIESKLQDAAQLTSDLKPVKPNIVYRLFNPQVPVILCAKFGRDVAAMPANSCSSLSDSPPMVSVAIGKGLRTNRLLRKSGSFSINWVNFEPEGSRRIVLELAKPYREKKHEDKLGEHKIPYSTIRGVPVLKQSVAFALCKVKKRIRTGDHDLFIASVVSAKAPPDFTIDGYWRFENYKPVLYIGSIRPDPLITISKEI